MISFASTLVAAIIASSLAWAAPSSTRSAKRATCTVNSVATANDVSDCSTVVIKAFTIPSGSTVSMAFADGASVTMSGDITVSKTTSSGPIITFSGDDVTFNGGDRTINGNGASYWDGEGTGGGTTKPHPLIKVKMSGLFEDLTVLNSPAHAVSIGNTDTLVVHGITVDNSAGASLGANTDCFDISASDLTVQDSTCYNQDDCFAINAGSNLVIEDNYCSGGHGISIGSIATGKTVSNVKIARNTVEDSQNGLRIKVDADATSASVSGVTYTSNTVSGITKYGVLITESYPDSYSTPGTGASISGISFTGGTTTVSVESSAYRVAVDCGNPGCSGTWDWSSLVATGGKGDEMTLGAAKISGGSY